jgi:hypothetical protein
LKLPAERYLQTTITITGIHNHDPPETVITIDRNPRSRWTGNHDHHRPERANTMPVQIARDGANDVMTSIRAPDVDMTFP